MSKEERRNELNDSNGYRCDTCEDWCEGEPNVYDDFECDGTLVQRQICNECVKHFESLDICFDFEIDDLQFENK